MKNYKPVLIGEEVSYATVCSSEDLSNCNKGKKSRT